MCEDCWNETKGGSPICAKVDEVDVCCFCGEDTWLGIYVRHDPNDPILKCRGKHEPS